LEPLADNLIETLDRDIADPWISLVLKRQRGKAKGDQST